MLVGVALVLFLLLQIKKISLLASVEFITLDGRGFG